MKMLPVLVASLVGSLAGCATTPKPLEITDVRETAATVTQLDLATRLVTLRDAGDREFTVKVGDDVRNLPQVKVGDKVVARYYESIGASLRKAGDPTAPTIELADAVAEPGQRPGALAGERLTLPVTIISVDTATHVVTFYGPDKRVRTFAVQTPEGRAFIRKLKQGDEVVVTFTEALAISVQPAG